jgi:hypothetical protein
MASSLVSKLIRFLQFGQNGRRLFLRTVTTLTRQNQSNSAFEPPAKTPTPKIVAFLSLFMMFPSTVDLTASCYLGSYPRRDASLFLWGRRRIERDERGRKNLRGNTEYMRVKMEGSTTLGASI